MTGAATPWPPSLAGTPAVSVIENAIGRGRLSHGLLLAGEDTESLAAAGLAIADRLLWKGSESGPYYPPDRHPDCFQVRPAGKARFIKAEAVRDLVQQLNVAPSVSRSRVAVIHDAERMNPTASNILLKTLEEPPSGTTLILLSGKPHALIPTIRSRVLHFRLPGPGSPVGVEGWEAWIGDYQAWLARLGQGVAPGRGASDSIMALYGLVARFGTLLDRASEAEGARRKALLPEGLDKDELEAVEAEVAVGLKLRMFAAIGQATRAHSLTLLGPGDDGGARRSMAAAVDSLERAAGLTRVNLNERAALEDFMLASLRIWTRR